jgi:hypothetical protein
VHVKHEVHVNDLDFFSMAIHRCGASRLS